VQQRSSASAHRMQKSTAKAKAQAKSKHNLTLASRPKINTIATQRVSGPIHCDFNGQPSPKAGKHN